MIKKLLGHSQGRILSLILALSMLLRIAVAFAMGDTVVELPGIFDQISYHNLALRVLGGHGFSFGELWWPITPANAPTAHWSFPYTLYLVAVYKLFGPHPLADAAAARHDCWDSPTLHHVTSWEPGSSTGR